MYRQPSELRKEIRASNYSLDEVELHVLDAINLDGSLTIDELSEKLQVSRSSVKRAISSLKDQKLIMRKGNNRYGYWVVQSS